MSACRAEAQQRATRLWLIWSHSGRCSLPAHTSLSHQGNVRPTAGRQRTQRARELRSEALLHCCIAVADTSRTVRPGRSTKLGKAPLQPDQACSDRMATQVRSGTLHCAHVKPLPDNSKTVMKLLIRGGRVPLCRRRPGQQEQAAPHGCSLQQLLWGLRT